MPPADLNENRPTLLNSEDNLGSRRLYVRRDSRELRRCDVHSPLKTVASRTFTEAQMNSNRMHAYDCIPLIVILETEPWPHFGKFYYLDSILFFRVSHSSFLTDEFRVQGPHRVEMEPVHKVSTCFQQPPIRARWNKPTSNCGLM